MDGNEPSENIHLWYASSLYKPDAFVTYESKTLRLVARAAHEKMLSHYPRTRQRLERWQGKCADPSALSTESHKCELKALAALACALQHRFRTSDSQKDIFSNTANITMLTHGNSRQRAAAKLQIVVLYTNFSERPYAQALTTPSVGNQTLAGASSSSRRSLDRTVKSIHSNNISR